MISDLASPATQSISSSAIYIERLAAVCEAMGVGLSMHSGTEFGITMAAMLHTAATTPYLSHDIDAHYHHLTDDIIVGGPAVQRRLHGSPCRPWVRC